MLQNIGAQQSFDQGYRNLKMLALSGKAVTHGQFLQLLSSIHFVQPVTQKCKTPIPDESSKCIESQIDC